MVDLPKDIKRQHLLDHLGRQGVIFRFRCDDLDDPSVEYRYKFAVGRARAEQFTLTPPSLAELPH
jgi:hypothetical protein